jgi:hypothetical protein
MNGLQWDYSLIPATTRGDTYIIIHEYLRDKNTFIIFNGIESMMVMELR